LDLGKAFFGGTKLFSHSGTKKHVISPVEFAKQMEGFGAGEIIIQSIEFDGMMNGYNYSESISIAKSITIPVTILGGAGKLSDVRSTHEQFIFNGYAAGSLFVYQGINRGVLINYPEKELLKSLFTSQ
jgi:cyclase